MEWLTDNWALITEIAIIIYAIAELIVKVTPSEKDNLILAKVVNFINKLVDLFIPNLKKTGGTHNKNLFVKSKKK